MTSNFTPIILAWYDRHRRDLPWRQSRSPYAIWLSEIILQQTRVGQGMAYWQRFVEAYPTVDDLASAPDDEVMRLWQGLGYYSRARNLMKAARQIVAIGHFPTTAGELEGLSGIGPYTAAAIASIAFGEAVAAIDGNVSRVLARRYGISKPINEPKGLHIVKALATELVPADRPGDFNQAMMDFGSLVCTPLSPHCEACPFVESCEAFRQEKVGLWPTKTKKVKVKTREMAYVYLRHGGQIAIGKRGEGDIWQGLWQPYLIEGSPAERSKALQLLAEEAQGRPVLYKEKVRHVLTHRVLLIDFYVLDATRKPSLPNGYQWIDEPDWDAFAKPIVIAKALPPA